MAFFSPSCTAVQIKKGFSDYNINNKNNHSFLSWKRKSQYDISILATVCVHFTCNADTFKTIVHISTHLVSRTKIRLYIHHQALFLFDTIRQQISLVKVDLHSIWKANLSIYHSNFRQYLLDSVDADLYTVIMKKWLTLLELHRVQKKCSVKTNKTKRLGNLIFLLEVGLF